MVRIGDLIRLARESKGWTQIELSKRSGVPQNTISRIEKYMTPFFDVACKLFDALNISPTEVWRIMKNEKSELSDVTEDMLIDSHVKKEKKIQKGDG
jgi:transcriptional regulator with XRE-family HTH domain